MRPVDLYVTGSSTAFSKWCPVNYMQNTFGIGLGFTISSGASLTATVQHTFDDVVENARAVTATRSGTTITVTDVGFLTGRQDYTNELGNHGLSVGDYVNLLNTGVFDGEYNVASVVSGTQYTLTSGTSGTATAGPNSTVQTARVYPHSSLAAVTARQDGFYAYSIMAIRLILTAWASGIAGLQIRQGQGR